MTAKTVQRSSMMNELDLYNDKQGNIRINFDNLKLVFILLLRKFRAIHQNTKCSKKDND